MLIINRVILFILLLYWICIYHTQFFISRASRFIYHQYVYYLCVYYWYILDWILYLLYIVYGIRLFPFLLYRDRSCLILPYYYDYMEYNIYCLIVWKLYIAILLLPYICRENDYYFHCHILHCTIWTKHIT